MLSSQDGDPRCQTPKDGVGGARAKAKDKEPRQGQRAKSQGKGPRAKAKDKGQRAKAKAKQGKGKGQIAKAKAKQGKGKGKGAKGKRSQDSRQKKGKLSYKLFLWVFVGARNKMAFEVMRIDSYTKLLEIEARLGSEASMLQTFVSGECTMYVFVHQWMVATVYVGSQLAAGQIVISQTQTNVQERAQMLQAVARWLRDAMHITKLVWPSAASLMTFFQRDKVCGYGSHIVFKRGGPKHKRWSVVKQEWINRFGKTVTAPRWPGKHGFVHDCWHEHKPAKLSLMDVNWLVAPLNSIVFENNEEIVEIRNDTPVLRLSFTEELAKTEEGAWVETGVNLDMILMMPALVAE